MKEILINYILIDSSSTVAIPVFCPFADNVDVLKVGDTHCCVYNDQKCKFLDSIVFEKDVNRTLFCKGDE